MNRKKSIVIGLGVLFFILNVSADSNFTYLNNGTDIFPYGYEGGVFYNTFYNISNCGIELNNSYNNGSYTSQVFSTSGLSVWGNISWIQRLCYGYDSDVTFYANYNVNVNGTWGSGSMIGTPYYGSNVVDGRLNLSGSGSIMYVDYDANLNADSQQVGAVRFTIMPDYTGIGNKHGMFSISKEHNSNINLISVLQWHNGQITLYVFNSSGSNIISQLLPVWSPVAGQEYEFELNWDITNGETRMFIDGIQHGSTITATGVRNSDIGLLRVGTAYHAISFPPDCKIDNFVVFDEVQHTSNYIPLDLVPCLDLKVRSCNDINCNGKSFIDIDDISPQDLFLDNNTYIQYGVEFEREDVNNSPELYNVTICYTDTTTSTTTTLKYEYNFVPIIDSLHGGIDIGYSILDLIITWLPAIIVMIIFGLVFGVFERYI